MNKIIIHHSIVIGAFVLCSHLLAFFPLLAFPHSLDDFLLSLTQSQTEHGKLLILRPLNSVLVFLLCMPLISTGKTIQDFT